MKLTAFQQKQKDDFLAEHQPPDDLSPLAKSKYLKAVNKITFTPTDEDGLAISYEHLSAEELFAIQEPWGVFMPASVTLKLRAASQNRLIDELRKDVLVLAHGESFKPKGKGLGEDTKILLNLMQEYPALKNNEIARKAVDVAPDIFKEKDPDSLAEKISRLRNQY